MIRKKNLLLFSLLTLIFLSNATLKGSAGPVNTELLTNTDAENENYEGWIGIFTGFWFLLWLSKYRQLW